MAGVASRSREAAAELGLRRVVTLYGYLSFLVAVGVMLVWSPLQGQAPAYGEGIALGVVGVATAVRTLLPVRLWAGARIRSYGYLALEVALALGTLLGTRGLDSGLLLYSLLPVLIASLFLNLAQSLMVSGILISATLVAHVVGGPFSGILTGQHLLIFLLYAIATVLIALMPYYANINLQRRLEMDALIKERNRLRREMHDGFAQEVAYLNLSLKELQSTLPTQSPSHLTEKLGELGEALGKTFNHVRGELKLMDLDLEAPLAVSLEGIVRDFVSRTGIAVDCQWDRERLDISPVAKMSVCAILLEGLHNIYKHAQTRQARVEFAVLPQELELLIEDHGRGFDPEKVSPEGHFGLQGIRERTRELGGHLVVSSVPEGGTRLRLTVPL